MNRTYIFLCFLIYGITCFSKNKEYFCNSHDDEKTDTFDVKIPLNIVSECDSFSYAAGQALTQGLDNYIEKQFLVTKANMHDFKDGLQKCLAGYESQNENALVAGMHVASEVKNHMIPNVKKKFDDVGDSLNVNFFILGFYDAVETGYSVLNVDEHASEFDRKSYIEGKEQTRGLDSYIKQQFSVSKATMPFFLDGLKKGLAGGEDAKVMARAAGMQIASIVKKSMLPSMNKKLDGTRISLNTYLFQRGFYDAIDMNASILSIDQSVKYFESKSKAIKIEKETSLKTGETTLFADNDKKDNMNIASNEQQDKAQTMGHSNIDSIPTETLEDLARKGDTQAALEIGRRLGCTLEGIQYYEIAAEAGNAEALFWCSDYYYAESRGYDPANLIVTSYGGADYKLTCLFKAGHFGNVNAMYEIGCMLRNRLNPPYASSTEIEKAKAWFYEAAKRKHVEASYEYAKLLLQYNGNIPDAVKYMKYAADKGVVRAWHWLGKLYEQGRGVTKNKTLMIKYVKMAAEKNCNEAMYDLGMYYYNGKGVPMNLREAYKWLHKAERNGFTRAIGMCNKIRSFGIR